MSYLIAEDFTDLRVDFLHQGTATAAAGQPVGFTSPASFNTDIATSSPNITLFSGSSYYLEASLLCTASSTPSNEKISFRFYNVTGASYIGQSCEMTMNPNFSANFRIGRRVCSALVLDSDISTSMIVQVRIEAITGSGWSFTGFPSWAGQPTIRILQLPS